jgi:hypothetical protein
MDVEAETVKLRSEVATLEGQLAQQETENASVATENACHAEHLNAVRTTLLTRLKMLHLPQWNEGLTEDTLDVCITEIQNLCRTHGNGQVNGHNNILFHAVRSAVAEIQIA